MAVQLISLNEIDKQFLDDNLLTDEDWQFDEVGSLEKALEETGLLEYIGNEALENGTFQSSCESEPMDSSVIELLCDSVNVKQEPLSPSSSSSSECSSQMEMLWTPVQQDLVPVLSIPDAVPNVKTEVGHSVPDTPPHTPPNFADIQSHSPPRSASLRLPITTSAPPSFTPSIVQIPSNPLGGANSVNALPQQKQGLVSSSAPVIIKPKPIVNASILNGQIGSSPLVLTPEQFAALTNGKLKVNSVSDLKLKQNIHSPPASVLQTSNCGLTTSKPHQLPVGIGKETARKSQQKPHVDLVALKRQQRMIKNRESACLSRKKKKEYVQKLEAEIQKMSAENGKLRMENSILRQRICDLEKENENLKIMSRSMKGSVSPKTSSKKTTGLMVVLFMLTFNLGPLSSLFEKKFDPAVSREAPPHRVGRTLLWEEQLSAAENQSLSYMRLKAMQDDIAGAYADDWESAFNITVCPTVINKTESQRLENDLRGWVHRVERKQKMKESIEAYQANVKKFMQPLPSMHSWVRKKKDIQKHAWGRRLADNEITVYHSPRKAYEDFFDAIHRRDDTFYFVSFSGDHLVLPATAHNQTLRPRMSLVMPAMTFNDSVGKLNEHISMMQIDCEVTNTKLVYVKESAIPAHLWQKRNNTRAQFYKKFMHNSTSDDNSLQKPKFNIRTYA